MADSKLYLVVRADLSPGQQAVQACHALREFSEHHPHVDRAWYDVSKTLVMLTVPDEGQLSSLQGAARERNVSCAGFREPDLNDALTALAPGPDARRLCRGLPLALRD